MTTNEDAAVEEAEREQAAIRKLKELFVGAEASRHVDLDRRVRRPVFMKPLGGARGTFHVAPDLDASLRIGVFAHQGFPAWVRFSASPVPQSGGDDYDVLGMSIKLLGVPGQKLLEGEEKALTHDFVLQNHDVFFVDDAPEFAALTEASFSSRLDDYLEQHPNTAAILKEMQRNEADVLLAHYSSAVPYAFGERYVKYAVRPVAGLSGSPQGPGTGRGDETLRRRLLDEGACFDFFLQFQADPAAMPLERATVRWEERLSPLIKVATIELPAGQDIYDPGLLAAIEELSFTSWHALPEHAPVGSLNRARRAVYKASADYRRRRNHVPLGEPLEGI
ncbi:hypothetical protein SOCE26_061240 [Sorangium cellulosum]|uniref:Uncharacterized protein n=1 Tax=Sorangium cellulosum TaxID=56 RepID=A0A2L0EZC3_SORCE|nr:catalase [Sorangium cellulosum]AUX44658.1 hypothetical protein SOCE26_061240 [Sorangium cellulosum]